MPPLCPRNWGTTQIWGTQKIFPAWAPNFKTVSAPLLYHQSRTPYLTALKDASASLHYSLCLAQKQKQSKVENRRMQTAAYVPNPH